MGCRNLAKVPGVAANNFTGIKNAFVKVPSFSVRAEYTMGSTCSHGYKTEELVWYEEFTPEVCPSTSDRPRNAVQFL